MKYYLRFMNPKNIAIDEKCINVIRKNEVISHNASFYHWSIFSFVLSRVNILRPPCILLSNILKGNENKLIKFFSSKNLCITTNLLT